MQVFKTFVCLGLLTLSQLGCTMDATMTPGQGIRRCSSLKVETVYRFDSEDPSIVIRAGYGTVSTITFTDLDTGRRVTMSSDDPREWWCEKEEVETLPQPSFESKGD